MSKTENKKLSIKSLGWLTIINLFVAVVGVLQTIVIAQLFGATRTVEIFFAATTFQLLLRQLSSTGQIGDLFTPIFHDIQVEHGEQASRSAFSVMTNVMLVIGVMMTILGVVFAHPISKILVPGFTSEQIELCTAVFAVTAPLAFVHVTNGMFGNFLRAEHHYGVSETLALISRVAYFAIIVAFGSVWGIWALVLGNWAGAVTRMFGLIIFAYHRGYRHWLGFKTSEFHPGTILKQVPFTFTHIFSAQFFAFAMTAGMSFLPEGAYASYTYAKQLHSKFQGMILQPIGVLFFNRFSQALAEGASRVKDYAHHALALATASVALCAVPIICGGDYLLLGLWRGKEFSVEQIQDTHAVLIALTLLLIANSQYLISRRTNLALKVVVRQFAASGAVMIVAGISCYWVIPAFGLWGAVAVMVLATVGTVLSTLCVLWFVDRDMIAVVPLRSCSMWFIAGGTAVLCTMALRYMLPVSFEADRLLLLVAACGYGLFSVAICMIASWLLGIPESREITTKIRSKLGRPSIKHA